MKRKLCVFIQPEVSVPHRATCFSPVEDEFSRCSTTASLKFFNAHLAVVIHVRTPVRFSSRSKRAGVGMESRQSLLYKLLCLSIHSPCTTTGGYERCFKTMYTVPTAQVFRSPRSLQEETSSPRTTQPCFSATLTKTNYNL